MNRHAGILKWLGDRLVRERAAAVNSKSVRQKYVHRVLAGQIEEAIHDLERVGREGVGTAGDSRGARPRVRHESDSGTMEAP